MSFIVTVPNVHGQMFFLRGTVWSFAVERATVHATAAAAAAALVKAKRFMPAKVFRAARIEELVS